MSDTLQAREKQELPEESTRPGFVFRPDIDILENHEGYVIYADLPGADDKSVDVRLDRAQLRAVELLGQKQLQHRRGRAAGRFRGHGKTLVIESRRPGVSCRTARS